MAVLYESGGYSLARLADLYQIPAPRVSSTLRNQGVEIRAASARHSPNPVVVTMALLYALDLSIARVGWLCGYKYAKARKMLLDAGVTLRGRGIPLAKEADVPRLVRLYDSRLSIEEAA